MKNWIARSFLFLSFIGVTSCSLDDEQDCVTGPVGFNVEFIDATTGENVYRVNRFQPSQLRVTDEDNKLVNYRFITELEKTFIQVNLGFETGEKTITMQLDQETAVDFEITLSAIRENCTTYYISKFEVPDFEYEESGTTGIVRVAL